MDELIKKIEEIEKRLSAIESWVGFWISQESQTVPPPPPIAVPSSVPTKPPTPPSYVLEDLSGRESLQETPKTTMWVSETGPRNLESYIGRWWLGIVGLVAIIFGMSFFIKYAFDNNWIGETGRIMLGIAMGLVFVVAGEILRSRIAKYSYILSGGGLALFYLSIYAAFSFYHLIGQPTAFLFMGLITAFGVTLSLFANAVELSALAVSGGFLTPYLLSTGTVNDAGFFSYIAILNIGILAVAFFKKWRQLTILGFTGTVLNFASWYGVYYNSEKLFFAISVLSAFYIIYTLAGVIANFVTKKLSDTGDLFVLTINPVWFFGWVYYLLKPQYENSLGFVAAGLAALYILFAYISSFLNPDDKRLTLFLGAIALVFLTIAIPLQLDQNAVTIAWAMEAAVLFSLGAILKNANMRMFALSVFLIAMFRLFAFDSERGNLAEFTPIFNKRFFTYFMVIFSSAVMAYVSSINAFEFTWREKGVRAFIGTALNILILIAISLEIYAFFDARIFELNRKSLQSSQYGNNSGQVLNDYGTVYRLPDSQEYRSLANKRNASISVFWTLYAVLLIGLGIVYKNGFLRWLALILFGVTVAKVFIFDLSFLATPQRIISFMVLGVILLIASYLYFRFQKQLEGTLSNKP